MRVVVVGARAERPHARRDGRRARVAQLRVRARLAAAPRAPVDLSHATCSH